MPYSSPAGHVLVVLDGGHRPSENKKAFRLKMLASHCFTWVFQQFLRRGPKSNERRLEVMRIQKFVIGYVLALALFLFAQQRTETTQPGGFREVRDLTHSLQTSGFQSPETSAVAIAEKNLSSVPGVSFSEQFATRMDAPARLVRGSWTVDQIPAGRIIAPLGIIAATASA